MERFLDILVYCSRLLRDFISSSDFSVCSCSFFVVNISSFFNSEGLHFTRQAWWEVQSIDREKSVRCRALDFSFKGSTMSLLSLFNLSGSFSKARRRRSRPYKCWCVKTLFVLKLTTSNHHFPLWKPCWYRLRPEFNGPNRIKGITLCINKKCHSF